VPRILIIAGPNGAGKTTVARGFLTTEAGFHAFVNADFIAMGLSPFAPEEVAVQAGRIMLEEIRNHIDRRESFAFETTLSGRGYARMIPRWQGLGFQVTLLYVGLNRVELSISRVAERVRLGGHSIPEDVIRRRFPLSVTNFERLYKPLVDDWILYDNSGTQPREIGRGRNS
jgi:predicted ABC-type ATPase